MTIVEIVRLLVRYFYYIAGTAVVLAALVFYSTKDGKKEYATHTLLNTGLISGYSIESSGSSRVDYAKTNNELENLINLATSYETFKELSARLMAYMLHEHQRSALSILPQNYPDFLEAIAQVNIEVNEVDSEISIYQKIVNARDADRTNDLYVLTNSENPFFGVEQLETIDVLREGNSDMIRMEYTSIDPLLSQKTLEFLTDIFIVKKKVIKEGQSDSVIKFFEDAVNESAGNLKAQEDELLNFRVDNQIINYYEQTRFISGNKEELDKQYQEELKVLAGAKSALIRVEFELGDKDVLPLLNTKLAESRAQISSYQKQLTSLELVMDTVPNNSRKIKKEELSKQINNLKLEMNDVANQLLLVNQTPDGIETKELLTQWLNNIIAKEESTAKLAVMRDRQLEYDRIYNRFAPLGSTLSRLEREIDVAEKEYLENLHSFNQARLHKYSMMMSSNLRVIDPPYYPIKPLASKRMMMVVLAFIVGMVLPSGSIIAMELLDNSLKNHENAYHKTKLMVGGILPRIPDNLDKEKINYRRITRQAMNLFVQQLRAETSRRGDKKKVIVFSTDYGEGKSFLIEQVEEFYNTVLKDEKGEFEFKELNAITHEPFNQKDILDADVHVMVTRANRTWNASDRHTLNIYKRLADAEPILFLNGVTTEVMENVIGDVPRERSWLRKTVKRLLRGGLKTSTI
ncbi:putative tyrosine kinase-like protein [Roseivirga pacifica]|uniref:G-rich domain on putative tyrosine kinase n=1 Tax=Roseivirga pacifica TaxID=1267423 RepID=A0A1I0Q711_9BACT|nr:GNVR domain-containing protein [Roseivirga pacifica]RKQ43184.1 putative tyrosine kinase-like protein [Roseivirga pacifica]SEW22708.1 G-rich domain on putative tyrosine kinase [Roseivirga pacifica]